MNDFMDRDNNVHLNLWPGMYTTFQPKQISFRMQNSLQSPFRIILSRAVVLHLFGNLPFLINVFYSENSKNLSNFCQKFFEKNLSSKSIKKSV